MQAATTNGAPVLAWVDASAGIAGDMFLGALIDAGAPIEVVQSAVDAVIPGTVRLTTDGVSRAGLRAAKVEVELVAEDQPDRSWAEVRGRLRAAALTDRVRDQALEVFAALAEVEAAAHGVPVDEVHFHEVGAWDSIADVVGSCAALEALGVTALECSPIALGSGTVRTAHGVLPVPVPAVLGLTAGWEVAGVGDGELATPTGTALLTALATRQGPMPPMQLLASGVGAGTRDVPGRANVVRVVIGRPTAAGGNGRGQRDVAALAGHGPDARASGDLPQGDDDLEAVDLVVLECNIDDLDPRLWPSVLDDLVACGAADAWLSPILMKKGRPAHLLSVLCHPDQTGALRDRVFGVTSTIGVRERCVRRWQLPRLETSVELDGHRIAVKVSHRRGRIVQATPEYRDVLAAATTGGRPARDVLDEAVHATVSAGLVPGAPLPETQPERRVGGRKHRCTSEFDAEGGVRGS
jgi:uncharacterized protein (TIGR00299 family) protein